MRPYYPTSAATIAVNSMLEADFEADRRRAEVRRHQYDRVHVQASAGSGSLLSRIKGVIPTRQRPNHFLNDYPCRLPDGRMGRVAVVPQGGEWAMVCQLA
ncbi:MAG: hypothetical protein MUQ32_02005 [Chloroflexi bacterium]|nr:hypothetical protein [Chloroflexota bacterium]